MSLFAIDCGRDDLEAARGLLATVQAWKQPPGRTYWTGEVALISPLVTGAARAFFLKIPPKTEIYRHRDPREVWEHFDTDHVVVATNDGARNCWLDAQGVEREQHLQLGHRYRVIDRGAVHWARNDGDTDRVHLLIEYPKSV